MNRLFFLIACLISFSLLAKEEGDLFDFKAGLLTPQPLFTPIEKSAFLPQVPKVNLVTGEYCEDACDLIVAGIEPLSIRRFYNHFSARGERIYGHWRINPEAFMLFNFESVDGSQTFVGIGERNSSFFCYERPLGNGFAMGEDKNKGFTNTLSGQNHPLNTRILFTKGHAVYRYGICDPEDHCWWEGKVIDGSGRERSFKTDVKQWPQTGKGWPCRTSRHPASGEIERQFLPFSPPYQSRIEEERRPNGNIIRYEYEDCNASNPNIDRDLPTTYALKAIKAYSQTGHLLGAIEIIYSGHSPSQCSNHIWLTDTVHFKGSDGRRALFSQPQRVIKKRVDYDTILSQIDASGKPTQSYNYHDYRNKKRDSYTRPPYLFQTYQPGGLLFETTYDGSNRVHSQIAPLGPQGEMVPFARYQYCGDHTIVYDGEDNMTLYRFDVDKRIIGVEKYQDGALYSVERSRWDAKTGNLLTKSIEDAAGVVFSRFEYLYDKNHNVIEERIDGASPLFRTYSDDGFNLKLTESDRPGKEIRYTYLPRTNLLSSEIVMCHGNITKRTFHFYDPEISSICIKTIVDDGSTANPDDLTGVTFRHVTEIAPKRTLPCLGLPEEVREYAGDQLLKKVRYCYHPSGQIASEEHYDTENQHRYTLYNTYDDQERLIATTDALGNKITYTYDNNFNRISERGPRPDQYKEWRYDLANRPIQQLEWQSDGTILISEQKYDKASRLILTIDPSGFETRYTYDALGRVTAIHHPNGAIEKREYDVLGNVTQETDPNGHVTRKSLNFCGKPTAIYHPDGTEEHFIYNPIGGTLATHTDRHGVTTSYTYDINDNLIQTETGPAITTAIYSALRLLSETDPAGVTTHVTYDLVGRKIAERKEKKELFFTYNTLGQLSQSREGDVTTLFSYDLKGHLLEKRIEGAFQENYTYDEAGNKTSITTCAGTCHTLYNSRGEPIQIIDPLGNMTTMTYSYGGGLTTTITDPKGITKTTLHDSMKRPIDLQTRNRSDLLLQREERKYDLAGNQTHAIHFLYEGTELKNTITHEWHYGPQGRLEWLIESGKKQTRYLYDNKGRLATLIKPDGRPIHREYDLLSRLSRYYGEGIDYAYSYDIKNRLIKIVDNIRKTTLESTYDFYDNVIAEKLDSGLLIRREFDPYGRRTTLYLPDTTHIAYTYKGPYLHTISRKGYTYTYAERNLSGKPTQIILPNHATITIDWDPLFRWKRYQTPHFTASYTYNAVGDLTQCLHQDPLGTEESLYHYDDLHQILSEKGHNYSYDSLYNRKLKDDQEYTLNTLFQLTSDGQHSYLYDTNGNLLSDGMSTYEYDLLDRLIVHTKKGKRTCYTYDALNRRIAKNDDRYIWDGQQEIGMIRHGYINELRILGEGKGAEIGAAVLLELYGISYIPIHDHRGSLVTLLDRYGRPSATYRYTAFGEPLNTHALCPWQFASKRLDPETGFIYFGKRYYSPALGRWITPDPQGFQDGANLYAYVLNNPLHYCDPYGLLAKSLAETHNIGDFCGLLWYYTCRTIEWLGHNLIPIPGARDLIESTGRWAYGGDFFVPKEHARILTSPGNQVEHMQLTYHNGIMTTLEAGTTQRDRISQAHGDTQVTLFYNPSRGLICDLITSVISKCGIKTAYEKMCAHHYATELKNDPQLEMIAYAHSQGGTRLNNIGNLLDDDHLERIKVNTFGSATIIPRERFKDVDNYASKIDFVPCTSGWSYLKNVAGFDSNVIFLTPSSHNPLTEHYLLGDTYWNEIKRMGNEFVQQYLGK